MKIKAAAVKEVGAPFEIKDDVELHDVGPTDLQIHMVASGICHSDEAIRRGDASLGYPVILGHEGAGIVEKVGSEVKNFKPGDHVILSFYSDGTCDNCLKGIPTQCRSYAKYNLSGVNMGDSIPQIDIPRLIEFYKLGWFDFDKTEKFYDFEEINQANADSVSGKTIKPVLIIDKDYRP